MANKCGLPSAIASYALQEQTRILRACASKLREQDTEALHDVRVASRRIRSILSEFKQVWSLEPRKSWIKHMREITRTLGKPRELDVSQKLLANTNAPYHQNNSDIPALSVFLHQQRNEHNVAITSIADYLASDTFLEEQDALLAQLKTRNECYRKITRTHLENRRKKIRVAYEKWTRNPDEHTLHRLRIELKKLRYACEFFQDALEAAPLNAYLERIREMQRQLGLWHDHQVLMEQVKTFSELANGKKTGKHILQELQKTTQSLLRHFSQSAETFFTKTPEQNPHKTPVRQHPCNVLHRSKKRPPNE